MERWRDLCDISVREGQVLCLPEGRIEYMEVDQCQKCCDVQKMHLCTADRYRLL